MSKSDIEDIYSLSPLQEGMLFHTLSAPESRAYFTQLMVTLDGYLDVTLFTSAWQHVLDRHPALRASFVWRRRDRPLQVVRRHVTFPVEHHDWRGMPPSEREARLDSFCRVDRERGFDLARAPLARLGLIRTGEDSHELIWSFHHLLVDGWSMFLVLKEVFDSYEAFRSGKAPRLEPPRPYRDYIAWYRRRPLAKAEAYWRRTLEGFAAPTPLIVDAPGGVVTGDDFAAQELLLDNDVTDALHAMARRYRLTPGSLVQGAWALLLHRYSGERDVVFGITVSTRPADLPGIDSMVGVLINTLPVRVRVTEHESVVSWVGRLQARLAELREYDWSPLVEVHGWSDVPRGQPLFESFLLFENYRKDAAVEEMGGSLRIHNVRWFDKTNYPLMALAVPGPRLLLRIAYHPSRFDADTIRRMLGHWRVLLEGIAAHPEGRLTDLELLTPAERGHLLVAGTGPQAESPPALHHLFEAQVVRTPEAVAVVFEGQTCTYDQLNRRANQLAHHLRAIGVGPEVRVGLCMERSIEMVVGLLGVLKAGGAYVPLDPAFPKDRLGFMLHDAQVRALLTQRLLAGGFPDHTAHVLCLDDGWDAVAGAPAENPSWPVDPETLAYVIYTSGSTGTPKGVAVSHRALANCLTAFHGTLGLQADDIFLALTTVSFDIAALELFLSLLAGARLVLVPREVAQDGTRLRVALDRSRATVVQATPATWRFLVEAGWTGNPRLKILCGGETLLRTLAAELLSEANVLWNLYGPTETTIWSAAYQVKADKGPVPIGPPIADTQFYVLDAELRLVPFGVPGELYIGGMGLARGYLNRPDLTAAQFLPHRFNDAPGTRLYRTGDLVRARPDGTFEFLGRRDHQVKLRGHRIELAEIETVLAEHPTIRHAAVLLREDAHGGPRLVAYVVCGTAPPPLAVDVRRFLREKLPEIMIPVAFIFLDALPLTPNGKVDRRALPPPDEQRSESGIALPRTALERTIAAVWRDVLRLDRVGLHDNFFDLGGHSLLLIRVANRLGTVLDRDISVTDLFAHPTVSALARHLSQEGPEPRLLQESRRRGESRRSVIERPSHSRRDDST